MLLVISPAKTLDYESASAWKPEALPEFKKQSAVLVHALRTYSEEQIAELMDISQPLAALNRARFKQWKPSFKGNETKPAIMAFKGDVYLGLQAESFSEEDMQYAQSHLRILSGLYGLLKPLDSLQPYRLEMGTSLAFDSYKNLYDFWGNTLTDALNKQLHKLKSPILVNLASNEYFKAVQAKQVKGRIITPVFKDFKDGEYKLISFFAKKARGLMAAYLIKNRISDPESIKGFDSEGYVFNEQLSKGDQWVFTRG